MKCEICNLETKTVRGLSYHISKSHCIKYKEYYDKFLKTSQNGLCKVCKKATNFRKGVYLVYCSKSCVSKDETVLQARKQKSIKTCLEKYGTEWNSQYVGHKIKVSQWWEDNPESIKSITLNKKVTNLKKYGVDNPAKTNIVRKRISKTKLSKTKNENVLINSKREETCFEKYGVGNVRKSSEIIDKMKDTKLKKYGKLYFGKFVGYSKISQKFFYDLYSENKEILTNINFATFNKEFSLKRNNGKNSFLYDFTCHNLKKIIEFNGKMFHPTDDLDENLTGWHLFKKNLVVKDIRELEREKIELAKTNGYDVLVIWDTEVKQDYKQAINKAKEFLIK